MKNESQTMTDTLPTFPAWGAAMGEWAEHDDLMTDEDFDRRRAQRDGWETGTWDGRW
jgi:hypothetical protein